MPDPRLAPLALPSARADRWRRPATQECHSADRALRFTVVPRALRSSGAYFSDMPEAEVARLPRTVSSIWWGRDHFIEDGGRFLVLRIVAGDARPFAEKVSFRLLRVELATGKVAGPPPR